MFTCSEVQKCLSKSLNSYNFAVVGIGDTGLSIIKYLKHHDVNGITVFDTRDNPPHLDTVKQLLGGDNPCCYCGKLLLDYFTDVDIIVLSPGVSIYEPVIQKLIKIGKLVVGDIELFAYAVAKSKWHSKLIGITGSNGKTTVTTLCGYLLESIGNKVLVCGNIGAPVLDCYPDCIIRGDIPDFIVMELSSFQLETTYSLQCDVATVLNISEDHLDRYQDVLQYASAKDNIFNNCKLQILNQEDSVVMAMKRANLPVQIFGVSLDNCNYALLEKDGMEYLNIKGVDILCGNDLQLVGRHNYLNCLATLALLDGVGVNIANQVLLKQLKQFKGVEHRMQKILVHNGVIYIEDSKGTNVGAVVAGLSGIKRPIHLILGGDGKGQDFSPLRKLVHEKCKSVAIIGQDKFLIEKVLSGLNLPIIVCDTLAQATKYCIDNAVDGDYVILSPACASWDMFKNYKHRAQEFVDSVHIYLSK